MNPSLTSLNELNYIPLIGLMEVGTIKCMNSILMCFGNLYQIANYFLDPKNKKYINRNNITKFDSKADSLSLEFKKLIDSLFKAKPETVYSPSSIEKVISKLNPNFNNKNYQKEPKDLLIFILNQLHKELNWTEFNNENEVFPINNKYNENIYDKEEVLKNFLAELKRSNKSLISNNFNIIFEKSYECQNCKMNTNEKNVLSRKYKFYNSFFIEFSLDEIINFKNSDLNEINLYDCFDYILKENIFSQNCEQCNEKNAETIEKSQLISIPNILVINFITSEENKNNITIKFYEYLDLSKIGINNNKKYELQNVIKEIEVDSSSKKYIAYCRSPIQNYNNLWYCYDNENISKVINLDNIYKNDSTCILFYQLK